MKKIGLVVALIAMASPLLVARSQGGEVDKKPVETKSAPETESAPATQSETQMAPQLELKTQSAPQAPKIAQGNFSILMSALETGDLGSFVAPGDATFAKAMTEPMFARISAQIAPRLKKGYGSTFLCPLKKGGYDVFLWKLSFKDGGDDMVASLSMKDGKVGGFFLI